MPTVPSHPSARPTGPLARASLVLVVAGLAIGVAAMPACNADGQKAKGEQTDDASGAADGDLAAQIQADVDEASQLLAERDGQASTTPAPADWGTPIDQLRIKTPPRSPERTSAANQPLEIEPEEAPGDAVVAATIIASGQPGEPEPTREEWIARLAEELAARLTAGARGSEAFRAEIAAAALSLASADASRTASSAPLTQDEAAVLRAWRSLIETSAAELQSGAGAEAVANAIRDAARDLGGLEPFQIARALLCTRVSGFGQYEEFPSTTFLAGRRNDAVLYVEVGNFTSEASTADSGWTGRRVALSQTVSLYHDADDALAWRQPEQETVDISRNQRRDFFVVQRITLPETLTVGRYNLKVAMRDLVSGQVAESIIPITIVADARLVEAPTDR